MTNTKVDLKIHIGVGILEGRSLEMKVRDKDRILYHHCDTVLDDFKLELTVTIPTDLIFEISGKGANDTHLSADGTVVADKFFRVDALCINGIWVKKWQLESRVFDFQGDLGESNHSNYWGFNGKARLVLPGDLLEFWLDMLASS